MTGRASARGYIGVVKNRGYPTVRVMAIITLVATGDMIRRLSGRCRAVMAGETAA